MFDGKQPYEWICRVERYFRLGQYSEEQKMELISLSLDGAVLNWYNWEVQERGFTNWSQFKERMLARFATSMDEEPGKRLARLTQIGSIHDYVSEFEELASQVTGIDETHLVNLFYTGLRREMKEVVKLKEPHGLTNHIAAVVKMEDSMLCQVFGELKTVETKPYQPYSTPQFRSSVLVVLN